MKLANNRLKNDEMSVLATSRMKAQEDLEGLVNHLKLAKLIEEQGRVLGRLIEWCFREMEYEEEDAIMSEEDCRLEARRAAINKLEIELICYGAYSADVRDTLDVMTRIG